MTTRQFAWVLATMVLGAGVATAQEPALLLVHGPAEAFGATPAWCYSTLAEPDCYTQPILEGNDRLIGAYLPVAAVVEPQYLPGPPAMGPPGRRGGENCVDHHRGSRVCAHSAY
jgi:hypothetical protein